MMNKFASIVDKFKKHENDTGSVELQVITLTKEIDELQGHCKQNAKDFSSRRGLLAKVNQRRRFLKYLKKNDEEVYKGLLKELGLRR